MEGNFRSVLECLELITIHNLSPGEFFTYLNRYCPLQPYLYFQSLLRIIDKKELLKGLPERFGINCDITASNIFFPPGKPNQGVNTSTHKTHNKISQKGGSHTRTSGKAHIAKGKKEIIPTHSQIPRSFFLSGEIPRALNLPNTNPG